MPKPKPDQAVFPQVPIEFDQSAENPFYHRWLYKTEDDKADTGCLPSPANVNARKWWNKSPISKVNKKLGTVDTTIGKSLPSLQEK